MLWPLLLAVDFLNFTYPVNPCSDTVVPIVVKKGDFSYWDSQANNGLDVIVEAVHEGSIAPATRQAVVVLTCQLPIGGGAEAYLFDERGNKAILFGKVGDAKWGPDWGSGPQSIVVKFTSGRLDVTSCARPDCETVTQGTYALRSGKLARIGLKTSPTYAIIKVTNTASQRADVLLVDDKGYGVGVSAIVSLDPKGPAGEIHRPLQPTKDLFLEIQLVVEQNTSCKVHRRLTDVAPQGDVSRIHAITVRDKCAFSVT